jgi:NAD(P) transhydrogenase subunit beta
MILQILGDTAPNFNFMRFQEIAYLLGSVSFVVGLKMMGKPDTARKGNLVAAAGMLIAIIGAIAFGRSGSTLNNIPLILGGIALGTLLGTVMAKKVQMTAMPQMVSLFNGMGGACAALIGIIEYNELQTQINALPITVIIDYTYELPSFKLGIIYAGLIIGSVSFAGSMIAYGKLEEKIKDIVLPGQQIINLGLLAAIIVLAGLHIGHVISLSAMFYVVMGLAIIYGILFVLPIGGADMPVVISLLNSFTGVAAACGGFLYNNNVMLMGGVLVGSAGTILTVIMCKAMNRSLTNVLIGKVGASSGGGIGKTSTGSVREVQATDVAVMMKYASKVVIVPGYGLAVAQAQHVCHELENLLEEEGVSVKYAIHPVAGRMPGHMNVLLAESNVEYDKLIEMEEINPEFATTDVVLVVGANDVVNPAAKTDPTSPIYGMPILDVEQAKQIIVLKRSMKSGYAGIENDLFCHAKTGMLFGDAKASLQKLVNEVKAL